MLSINGSPLANPFELGLTWLADDPPLREADEGNKGFRPVSKSQSRSNSNIVIRRDPSHTSLIASSTSQTTNGTRSRTNSQSDLAPSSSYMASHSRPNSRNDKSLSYFPSSSSGGFSARVAVPTKDGHLLEFDPLQTSPSALDKLEGITDSAKKQAKDDMSKLMKAAVAKWNIT